MKEKEMSVLNKDNDSLSLNDVDKSAFAFIVRVLEDKTATPSELEAAVDLVGIYTSCMGRHYPTVDIKELTDGIRAARKVSRGN